MSFLNEFVFTGLGSNHFKIDLIGAFMTFAFKFLDPDSIGNAG